MRVGVFLFVIAWTFSSISQVHAVEIPTSVVESCTTNSKIYHKTILRTGAEISKDQKRKAVFKALGFSTSNPNLATHNFRGQWFFERESDAAIYTGYKIRSHYLSTAVVYTDEGLVTIICDSENLKQGRTSIHKKAPLWKGTLDSNIRIELGQTAAFSDTNHQSIESLNQLYSKGLISREEYDAILSRIESKSPSSD